MKILQVVGFFSPSRGGGVIAVVYQLSKALAARGHEVTIYTSDFELDSQYVASIPKVKVNAFHNVLTFGGRPLVMSGVTGKVRQELAGFDIVHMHEVRGYLNAVIHHYARRYEVPYIIDAHGATARKSKSRIKWVVDHAFGRRVLTDATKLIAETDLGAKEYAVAGADPNRVVTLYPPFPVEDYANLPRRGLFRERFNIPEDKKIIMFLGRIAQIKGVDFLVDTFCELSKLRDDVVLAIVGSDDGFEATIRQTVERSGIADRVVFTGYMGGADKQAALVDAAVLAQPSVYEQGLAWASIEAVLCDVPIVVSKNTGAAEDAIRMGAGYLVEYGNREELRTTIQHVLDDATEAWSNTRKAKEYVLNNLSMQKKVQEYEKIYSSCLKDAR